MGNKITPLKFCVHCNLSVERFERYCRSDEGSVPALARYLLNIQLCEALYPTLNSVEVGLRNCLHNSLSAEYGPEWYDTPGLLGPAELASIADAHKMLSDAGRPDTPSRIVSELSFGFWTRLMSRYYYSPNPEYLKPWPRLTKALAWNKTSAATYAETYAIQENTAWPYLLDADGRGADCTNFISQSLKYGGIAMDTTRIDRSQWYMAKNMNNAWIWGYPWTVAQNFFTYFRTNGGTSAYRYYIATSDWISTSAYVAPPNSNASLNKGDIVSYDLDLSAADGIDHNAIVTYTGWGINNGTYLGDLVCYHSTDTKRIIWHVKHRLSAAEQQEVRFYTWGLDSTLN